MASGEIRIGTSGWHYAHWRGLFYPEGLSSEGYLAFYREYFDVVEINNTFYRLPEESTLATWRDTAGDGFLFAAKASRYLTHMKKLKDPEEPAATVLRRLEVLGDRLGPILFQLPPRWRVNVERLAHLLEILPTTHRYAFEFRDGTWFDDRVYALLAEHRAALCIYHMGTITTPKIATSDLIYIRLHGPSDSPTGHYLPEALAGWAEDVERWAAEGRTVYCFFNNDAEGYAIADSQALRGLLGQVRQVGR
ncbi:MAG: DUF72 domain-containing protein [Chloroflexi bacterium]|nr:DUF72 domain-containing protein [Chloroflexota bacterium]